MSPLAQNPPSKFKKCFFILNYTKPLVIKGFEQLSSSIAWQVIGLQSSTRKVAHAGLKGSSFVPASRNALLGLKKHFCVDLISA